MECWFQERGKDVTRSQYKTAICFVHCIETCSTRWAGCMNQEVHHSTIYKGHVDYLQALKCFTTGPILQLYVVRTLLLRLPCFSFRCQPSRCLTQSKTGWFVRTAILNWRNIFRRSHSTRRSFYMMSVMNSKVQISSVEVLWSRLLERLILSGFAP